MYMIMLQYNVMMSHNNTAVVQRIKKTKELTSKNVRSVYKYMGDGETLY